MKKRIAAIVLTIAVFSFTAAAQRASITPNLLRGWLTYLASDELEGRATFSEGLGLAAAYIANQMERAGVQPGGENGTYFQRVSVLGVRSTNRSTLAITVNGVTRTFRDGEGIAFPRNVGGKRTLTLNEIEFVGYGLYLNSAHNDYKDLDVKGKAVVWMGSRGPLGTVTQEAGRLLRGRASLASEEMGASATIAPPPDVFGGGRGGAGGTRGARGGIPAQNTPDFTTAQRLDLPLTPNVTATDELMEFLFSGSDIQYAELRARAQRQDDLPKFPLKGVTLTFNLDADYQVVNTRYTRNVIGVVNGTDVRLKETYVAFGAHYDHVGYSQGVLPVGVTDRISNGADDDGSGTAILMALARAFAQGPKTKRSLLFVWHSGEELGQWGSKYFADYPTVPIDKIVAHMNMDMVGRDAGNLASESNTVYPVGSDRISSELHNIMVDANSSLPKPMVFNYQLNDPTDAERVYYRSDHYSYAAKGIPVIFFTTFLHPDYHRVTDSVEKINFEKMANIGQLVYEIGRRVANLDHAPARDVKGPRLGKGGAGKVMP